MNSSGMGDDADRFRKRAEECRRIAANAKDEEWRKSLLDLARDLDEEADRIDREQAG